MEEKREHLRQIDVRQSGDGSRKPTTTTQPGEPEQSRHHRSLCLICGKIEKTPGTGSFYKIMEETWNKLDSALVVWEMKFILGWSIRFLHIDVKRVCLYILSGFDDMCFVQTAWAIFAYVSVRLHSGLFYHWASCDWYCQINCSLPRMIPSVISTDTMDCFTGCWLELSGYLQYPFMEFYPFRLMITLLSGLKQSMKYESQIVR